MAALPTSRLDGKVALVTGSGRGIGRGIAMELARRGANVVITYNTNSSAAQKTLKEVEELNVKATVIQADVSDPKQIADLFDKAVGTFGKLDIVVSNAGIEHFAHISEVTAEDFDKVFAVNTRGQLLVAHQAWKHCNDGGRLIMMSSIGANAKGINNHSIYSASKASIEAFARSLAV
ncbi:MAG: hypothetical protein Q9212_007574, partial [Teloschistes hypoglaucus]